MPQDRPCFTVDASWVGRDEYEAHYIELTALWGGLDNGTGVRRVAPVGTKAPSVPNTHKRLWGWQYTQPYLDLPVSWVGAAKHWAFRSPINRTWKPFAALNGYWLDAEFYEAPENHIPAWWGGIDLGTLVRRISPVPISAPALSSPKLLDQWGYAPPYLIVDGKWAGSPSYTQPDTELVAAWIRGGGEDRYDQYVVAVGAGDALSVGAAQVSNDRELAPAGWYDGGLGYEALVEQVYLRDGSWLGTGFYSRPGPLLVHGWWSGMPEGGVYPIGMPPSASGNPLVRNAAESFTPVGIASSVAFGDAYLWNYHTYVSMQNRGANHQIFGVAYVQGGVKFVDLDGVPRGIAPPEFPQPRLNRYTQDVKPQGIIPPLVVGPIVRPYILHAHGIYGTSFSEPNIQFPPMPKGWLSSAFGYPVVDYKTKQLRPVGFDTYETGAAAIRDRALKIRHDSSQNITAVFGDVLLNLKNFYARPDGIDSLAMSIWAQVWSNRRTIDPSGLEHAEYGQTDIANKSPQLWPSGIDAARFGPATDVGYFARDVVPSGVILPFDQVPSPSLSQTPSLSPRSIAAPVMPDHTVWFRLRKALMDGFDTQQLPEPTVWYRWRVVDQETHGAEVSDYGKPAIAHGIRYLEQRGSQFMVFGGQWVSHGQRVIDLHQSGIEDPKLSLHHVGYTRQIQPHGFEATGWLRTILPERQDIYPKSIIGEVGWPTVENFKRYLKPIPGGITTYPEPAMHWGFDTVWNLRQVVVQEHVDEATGLHPPQGWGEWTLIENRNKTIGAIGSQVSRHGYTQVDLKARPVLPVSIQEPRLPEWQKTGAVTHRIRMLPLEGLEPPYISSWSVVWNKADPIYPSWLVATEFGTASLVNTRRSVQPRGFEAREHGYPMIADRIRELGFDPRYTIGSPRIELPTVYNSDQYIEPTAIDDPDASVLHIVTSHRNVIHPQWSKQLDAFGYPRLRNMTPELLTRGRAADEWGDAFVRLEWRPVEPEGHSTQLFGKLTIADSTREVIVPGRNFMAVSDKLTFRRIGEDPVVTQYIDLRIFITDVNNEQSERDEGFGIGIPTAQVPAPDLMKGYVFHRLPYAGGGAADFGKPIITANTIRVEPGVGHIRFDGPFVSLKIRTLEVETIGQLVVDGATGSESRPQDMGSWGKPRFSPHTIYAVLEAPDQAVKNHNINKTSLRPVNAGERMGQPSVTQYLGIIKPVGITEYGPSGNWGVGRPGIVMLRQYIYHEGSMAQRFGWPVIPGDQYIDVEDGAESTLLFGRSTVGRPPEPPPPIQHKGFSASVFGSSTRVEDFHRTVMALGWLSEKIDGKSTNQTGSNMPQQLTVGPPNLHEQVGFVASDYGDAWFSHRVRELVTEGHDSFVATYDRENFQHRMRVWRAEESQPVRIIVAPVGFASTIAGVPDSRNKVHYILPDGNAEQYRKGAPNA